MTLERGTLLHKRYRIVEILGQGGMGSVYRAVDENLGVDVAVKENLFTSDEYSKQFRLEAVILAGLRHPNLPRVSDHFAIGDEGQYLVMDFIEGEDLRQRMERLGTVSEEDAVMVGAAMCDALTYLHTRKPSILHRDIKPGNVKISPEGTIYLVDFGLAKLMQGPQATTTGARAMTPGYSPPEQYGTARTDARTDIYSLGATLYAGLDRRDTGGWAGARHGQCPAHAAAATQSQGVAPRGRRHREGHGRGSGRSLPDRGGVQEGSAERRGQAREADRRIHGGTATGAGAPDRPVGRGARIGSRTAPGRWPRSHRPPPHVASITTPKKRSSAASFWLTLVFVILIAAAGTVILLPQTVPANVRAMAPLLFTGLTAGRGNTRRLDRRSCVLHCQRRRGHRPRRAKPRRSLSAPP